jgi:hypothetical protein
MNAQVKEIQGHSTITHKSGASEETEENLGEVVATDSPMAEIVVELGHTMNLGNFESLRIHVGIRWPVPANDSAIETAFKGAKAWVEKKLDFIVQDNKK